MAVVVTDKRFIDKDALLSPAVVAVAPTEAVKPLVVIHPETLKKAEGEAVRGWLLSVMVDPKTGKTGQQVRDQSV